MNLKPIIIAMSVVLGALQSYAETESGLSAYEKRPELPMKEIRDLTQTIRSASLYQQRRTHSLDSLRGAIAAHRATPREWEDCYRLACEYPRLNSDSALKYSREALRLAEDSGSDARRQYSRIALVNALSAGGVFAVAEKWVERLAAEQPAMAMPVKLEFWQAARKCYAYYSQYVKGDKELYRIYSNLSKQYDDSLIANLPAESAYLKFLKSERLVEDGKYAEAKTALDSLMRRLPQNDNLYGMAAYQLAEVYRHQGNMTAYAANLAKSAKSDVMTCTNEGLSLAALADWLYHEGDLETAFLYINHALNASNGGSLRLRMTTTASMVPVIDKAYNAQITRSRNKLKVFGILATLLLVACCVLFWFLYVEIRNGRRAQRKLQLADRIKDSYIANFLGLCSSYSSRLDHLQVVVSRKIESGQTKELLKIVNSGKVPEQDDDKLYETLDRTLFDIDPDFVEHVNELLRPEERIEVAKRGLLTPELRIYALVRLGVDESVKIAKILRYSTSTVYNYRNRMRNKAVDREHFDLNVKNMGLHDV